MRQATADELLEWMNQLSELLLVVMNTEGEDEGYRLVARAWSGELRRLRERFDKEMKHHKHLVETDQVEAAKEEWERIEDTYSSFLTSMDEAALVVFPDYKKVNGRWQTSGNE